MDQMRDNSLLKKKFGRLQQLVPEAQEADNQQASQKRDRKHPAAKGADGLFVPHLKKHPATQSGLKKSTNGHLSTAKSGSNGPGRYLPHQSRPSHSDRDRQDEAGVNHFYQCDESPFPSTYRRSH